MCSIEAHEKPQKSVNKNEPINGDKISVGARQLPSNSTKESLKPFGLTLN